jgi:two-component system sensor histidine kinase/response regulator
LVHLMKGTLGLESSLGTGSMFWFQIPFSRASNPESKRSEACEVFRQLRVLVVDDNATNRHILDQYLNGWGVTHVTVSSGKEAMEVLRRTIGTAAMYDLAIIDGQMPEMDGFALARAIRADTRLGTMKIIMLTSMGQDERLLASEHAGDLDCAVAKPVRQSHLYNRLLALTTTGRSHTVPSESLLVGTGHPECQNDVSVLVAEDNPVNREAAAEMLAVEGYQVHTVCNGREAVEAVAGQTFDVVFMDCQMPVMDGFTATAAIRDRERDLKLPRVPIVALTAHAIAGDRERCLAHDMDDYLSKPFRQSQLIAVVRRWVSEGRSVAGSTPEVTGSDASAVAVVGESVDCLDERTLQDWRALRRPGRRDPYVGMLTRYLDSSREYLATIYQNIAAQDAAGLAQTTHSLKSSSAMVGAMTLAEHVKKLEAIARSGNLSVASHRGTVGKGSCISR